MCSVLPPYVSFHEEHHPTVHTIYLWHLGLGLACVTVALPTRTLTIHRWIGFLFFCSKKIKSFNLEILVMLHQGTHRAVINLLQLASTQCGVGQCISTEVFLTYFNLPQLNVVLFQCVPHRAVINLLQPASNQCGFDPAYPHRAIVILLQLASTQCGVGPVCAP